MVRHHGTGFLWLLVFLLGFPLDSRAGDPEPAPIPHRIVSLIGGMGSAMGGGLGVQAEFYFLGDSLSVFGGAGHVFEGNDGEPGGTGDAAGARVYAGSRLTRYFLELSVSTIAFEYDMGTDTPGLPNPRYGPVVQLGFQHAGLRGFSFMLAGGIAYLPGRLPFYYGRHSFHADRWSPRFTIGMGHTWR